MNIQHTPSPKTILLSSKVSVIPAFITFMVITIVTFFGQRISTLSGFHFNAVQIYIQIGTILLLYLLLIIYHGRISNLVYSTFGSGVINIFDCYDRNVTEKTLQGFLLSRIALLTNIVAFIGIVILPFYFEFSKNVNPNYLFISFCMVIFCTASVLSFSIFGFTSIARLVRDRYIDLYDGFFGKHTEYFFQELIAGVYIIARIIYLSTCENGLNEFFSLNSLVYLIVAEVVAIIIILLVLDFVFYIFDDY